MSKFLEIFFLLGCIGFVGMLISNWMEKFSSDGSQKKGRKTTKIEACSDCHGSGYHTPSRYDYDGDNSPCTTCGGKIKHGGPHYGRDSLVKGSGKQRVIYDEDGSVIKRERYGSSKGTVRADKYGNFNF